jgi:hypothetical protein
VTGRLTSLVPHGGASTHRCTDRGGHPTIGPKLQEGCLCTTSLIVSCCICHDSLCGDLGIFSFILSPGEPFDPAYSPYSITVNELIRTISFFVLHHVLRGRRGSGHHTTPNWPNIAVSNHDRRRIIHASPDTDSSAGHPPVTRSSAVGRQVGSVGR